MKNKFFFFLILISSLVSCVQDDYSWVENEILGEWKCREIRFGDQVKHFLYFQDNHIFISVDSIFYQYNIPAKREEKAGKWYIEDLGNKILLDGKNEGKRLLIMTEDKMLLPIYREKIDSSLIYTR